MTAVMDEVNITSERLEEWKEILPRAGPKYRLGMYFDTIHEVPEFDAILDPENGYASCWESETDIGGDDDFGSLIFADLDGDSASVICLDDKTAQELCERWKNRQTTTSTQRRGQVADIPSTSCLLERTYDEIADVIKPEEHVYEDVDDCVNAYQIFISNASNGSNESPDNDDYGKIAVKHQRKTPSPPQKSKRTNSLPINQLHHTSPYKHQRKYSDCTEYSRLNRRNHTLLEEKNPVYSTLPPPLPPPNGATHNSSDYAHLFKYPEKTPSPEHREMPKCPGQSVVLKHKGKSYVLPISDDSKKSRRHSNCTQPSPKHTAAMQMPGTNLLQSSPSAMSQLNCHTLSSPGVTRSASMSFQAQNSIRRSGGNTTRHSPEHKDTIKRTKSKHLSTQSAPPTTSSQPLSKHVTLYGVL